MVLEYIAFPVEGLVWGLPMYAEKKLEDYRRSNRDNPLPSNTDISTGFAEDAIVHGVSYFADINGLWIAECLRWPGRIVKKAREYRSSGGVDLSGDAAVAEGIIGGLIRLHHLLSTLEYETPYTENQMGRFEEERANETEADSIVRKTKAATAIFGAAGYVAAACLATPWALAPLVVSNVLDCVLVYHYPREVFDDPNSGV